MALYLLSAFCLMAGLLFFLAGTLGLLRLPDLLTRLHALTKADNLDLGLVILGLVFQTPDQPLRAFKLLLIWLFVLIASATGAHLIAQRALRSKSYQDDR
ncbi:monovalent cation/H(+) antiporter subunit G [Caldichromatium japonicum]|uniref:Monovalent cation/H(+) antiporter subunit G n=2 Tax=Caldichromatium japonicum TaxID=2699430 RepID=A0A6G7VGU9_9GAMM|nr:monovalent cation/H(+) antiporter subunit G [Caldichromatium japonicum]QIK39106.1 monovalent cation/H(+) antiporter subunit G [Caldichromatium japonicum]